MWLRDKKYYIVFDIGQVLMHVNFQPFFDVMKKVTIFNTDQEVWEWMDEHEKQDFLGMLSLNKLLNWKFKELSDKQKQNLINAWNNSIYPNETMVKFLDELQKHQINIALLSNIGDTHANYIKNTYPEIFRYKTLHLSYEVGSFKPHLLFYQSFLLKYPEFAECLYVDDREENLNTASILNFSIMHFDLSELNTNSKLQYKLEEIRDRLYL